MKCCVPILIAWLCPAAVWSASPRDCIGSVPVATLQIRVSPGTGAAPLPLRLVNAIAKGYKIACTPAKLPPDLRKSAKIALVVVPWPSPTPAAPLFVWLRGDTEGRPAPVSARIR
jgi:hypothetical protein